MAWQTSDDNCEVKAYGYEYDKLSYSSTNQLKQVTDNGLSSALAGVEQFVDGADVSTEYLYDSGNLIEDKNKDIDIAYNHLNKPTEVELPNGNKIAYIGACPEPSRGDAVPIAQSTHSPSGFRRSQQHQAPAEGL